jgi:hypothetical protein
MNSIMQETTPDELITSVRQGHSAFSVLVATFLTMIVVLLISNFSFLTSVALGSFAGFCVAAWNWFRMGRRRKALVHVQLGVVVYLLFQVGYVLIAVLLILAFPSARPEGFELYIPRFDPLGISMFSTSTNALLPILLTAYCLIVVVSVLFYLYRATAHDVPNTEPLDNNFEIDLKRLLSLLAVAAISSVAITIASIFALQIRTAQLQNHVYCELLQPGMTRKEVNAALDKVGSHLQGWPEDLAYPALSKQATSYDVVLWDNSRLYRDYNLDLWLGYDVEGKLVWKGREGPSYISTAHLEQGIDTIECPWTFSQSVTAR